MITNCPACGTRYMLDPVALGAGGRVVRCAKCQHEWLQVPSKEVPVSPPPPREEAPPAPPPPPPPPPPPVRDLLKPAVPVAAPVLPPLALPKVISPPVARSMAPMVKVVKAAQPRLGLIAAGVGLVVVLSLLFIFRQSLVGVWPPIARLYGAVGIETTPPPGLEFRNLRYERTGEGAQAVLQVTGEVVNLGKGPLGVPPVRVALLDGAQHELSQEMTAATAVELAPGATATFDLRMLNPPADAVQVAVTFGKSP